VGAAAAGLQSHGLQADLPSVVHAELPGLGDQLIESCGTRRRIRGFDGAIAVNHDQPERTLFHVSNGLAVITIWATRIDSALLGDRIFQRISLDALARLIEPEGKQDLS
jgi:hypothetical protein